MSEPMPGLRRETTLGTPAEPLAMSRWMSNGEERPDGTTVFPAPESSEGELAALRTWRAQAEPLLRALADAPLTGSPIDGDPECLFCDFDPYMKPHELGHKPDCPIVLARALLGEGGQ